MLCCECQALVKERLFTNHVERRSYWARPWKTLVLGSDEAKCTLCCFLSKSILTETLLGIEDIIANSNGRIELNWSVWPRDESVLLGSAEKGVWRQYIYLHIPVYQELPKALDQYVFENHLGHLLVFPTFEFHRLGRCEIQRVPHL
jgi:hypothetical protein